MRGGVCSCITSVVATRVCICPPRDLHYKFCWSRVCITSFAARGICITSFVGRWILHYKFCCPRDLHYKFCRPKDLHYRFCSPGGLHYMFCCPWPKMASRWLRCSKTGSKRLQDAPQRVPKRGPFSTDLISQTVEFRRAQEGSKRVQQGPVPTPT